MFLPPKPQYRNSFRQDLANNLMILSNNGALQLYKYQVITECVMYSCDMCLEFQRKSDGLLTSDWIDHITKEAGEALKTLLPGDIDDSDISAATDRVHQLLRRPAKDLQDEVDRYYGRL